MGGGECLAAARTQCYRHQCGILLGDAQCAFINNDCACERAGWQLAVRPTTEPAVQVRTATGTPRALVHHLRAQHDRPKVSHHGHHIW